MITVTPSAVQYLVNLLNGYNRNVVELSLAEQGCNGYKYVWTPIGTSFGQDNTVILNDDCCLVFSKETALHIAGSTVDIVTEQLSKRLIVNNPNVAYACGCGESVNFK